MGSLASTPPLAALALVALGAAGCGTSRVFEAQGTPSLRTVLEEVFANDARFANRVDVSVSSRRPNVVTLSGDVAEARHIEDAGRLAASVRGVAVIYNMVEVEKVKRPSAVARAARRRELIAGVR